MLLNCDMGEHLDSTIDELLMPHIDQASIACGFHAGNLDTMRRTLALAKTHGVSVGAHPSYNDKEGFGRRSKHCSTDAITVLLHAQISILNALADEQGVRLAYVKPHGALYNDMMLDSVLRASIMTVVAEFTPPLYLVLQATEQAELHRNEAKQRGLALQFEAFADRCYDDNGLLLSRSHSNAVHNEQNMLQQVEQLCKHGTVTTVGGNTLALTADTLCVHGDNPAAVAVIQTLRASLSR